AVLGARPAPAFVEVGRAARAWWERPAAALRRALPDPALVRAAAVVVGGFGVARLLGFAFQVAAGRILAPADYGRLTYALAVAGVLSVLVTTAPLGLSRALARHAGD